MPGSPSSPGATGAPDAPGAPAAKDPLLALRAGDAEPFEEFVRARTRTLVAFFRQRGAALGRAEDLTREVFLKLYQSAARYEPRERFESYCFRLARNTWIDECRRAGARPLEAQNPAALPHGEPAAPRIDPVSGLVRAEEERGLA